MARPKVSLIPVNIAPKRYRQPKTTEALYQRYTHQRLIATPAHPDHNIALYQPISTQYLALAAAGVIRILTNIKILHDANAPSTRQHLDNMHGREGEPDPITGEKARGRPRNLPLVFTYLQLSLHKPYTNLTEIYEILRSRPARGNAEKYKNQYTWRKAVIGELNTTGIDIKPKHKEAAQITFTDEQQYNEENENAYREQLLSLIQIQLDIHKIAKLSLDFDAALIPKLQNIHHYLTTLMQILNPHTTLQTYKFNISPPPPLPLDTRPYTPTHTPEQQRRQDREAWHRRRKGVDL